MLGKMLVCFHTSGHVGELDTYTRIKTNEHRVARKL